MRPKPQVLAILALVLSSQALASSHPGDMPPEHIPVDIGRGPIHNDIPNEDVLAILKERFDHSKAPLSTGDLYLGARWSCREFYTEATGNTNYRFKSFSFRQYDGAILEDELNNSPRFYLHQSNGELIGASSSQPGVKNVVRVDHDGNLRIATVDSTKTRSYFVCFRKHLAQPQR